MDGQSIPPKTPEQIRAERIAAIDDPKLRQQLDEMVKARDAQLAQVQDRQKQMFDKRVEELRDQKIKSANAPQLTPTGYRSPYLGRDGHALAESQAKTQIQTLDSQYLKAVAKEHNDQIDKRLDDPSREATRPAALQRSTAPTLPAARSLPKPNRYAQVIDSQNYAARAAKEAEANRERDREQQQQQRQRGSQR